MMEKRQEAKKYREDKRSETRKEIEIQRSSTLRRHCSPPGAEVIARYDFGERSDSRTIPSTRWSSSGRRISWGLALYQGPKPRVPHPQRSMTRQQENRKIKQDESSGTQASIVSARARSTHPRRRPVYLKAGAANLIWEKICEAVVRVSMARGRREELKRKRRKQARGEEVGTSKEALKVTGNSVSMSTSARRMKCRDSVRASYILRPCAPLARWNAGTLEDTRRVKTADSEFEDQKLGTADSKAQNFNRIAYSKARHSSRESDSKAGRPGKCATRNSKEE
ncbi:hypothetical protein C8R45DRAFT_1124543 [Mycena sanguinolenta]|nr:hypothetical protein C8R45DRAFT_1124543 [Mycena sanguinolenta]